MNKKGQSLVLFVLIIPIIILILLAVYKIGKIALLKESIDNINYLAIDYATNHLDEENIEQKVKEIIKKNNNELDDINISIDNDKIYVTISKKIDGINIKSALVGYIYNDKLIIEKNK